MGAGAWRIVLMPVDTVKTCLQVDGPEGWKTLQKRVQKDGLSVLFNGKFSQFNKIVYMYVCMYVFTDLKFMNGCMHFPILSQ